MVVLIRGGMVLLIGGALFVWFKRRGAVPCLLAGVLAVTLGLLRRAWFGGGFHLELATFELALLPPGWTLLVLGFLARGREGAARAVAPCIVVVGLLAVLSPLAVTGLDLKMMHPSVPLFYVTEGAATVLFAAASCLAVRSWTMNEAPPEPLTGTLLLVGFVVFSCCQFVGAWWAWLGWAAPFHWSARHLISAAVWCVYAAALHLRFTTWPPRRRSLILALSLVPLTFLQVAYDAVVCWSSLMGMMGGGS